MAVQFESDHTRQSLYLFFPENLKIVPELNGRHDLPDIAALVQDILARGQIVPVQIRKDGGDAVLIAGFSRWRAISYINEHKLAPVKMQVKCVYTQCTEAEGFLSNIAENLVRNSTTQLDDARNLHLLTSRYAMTEEQAAKVYFPKAKDEAEIKAAIRWVKKRLSLYDLVPEAQEAVKDGRLKGGAAVAIAKLSEAQQRAAVRQDGTIKAATTKPKKSSKLKSLAEAIMKRVDDDDYASAGEYITVPLQELKALMGAIL